MPDSCCKTVVARCGRRAHPSNIYKVEVSTPAPASIQGSPDGGFRQTASGQGHSTCVHWPPAFSGPHNAWGSNSCSWEILGHHACPPTQGHPRRLWAVERLDQAP